MVGAAPASWSAAVGTCSGVATNFENDLTGIVLLPRSLPPVSRYIPAWLSVPALYTTMSVEPLPSRSPAVTACTLTPNGGGQVCGAPSGAEMMQPEHAATRSA